MSSLIADLRGAYPSPYPYLPAGVDDTHCGLERRAAHGTRAEAGGSVSMLENLHAQSGWLEGQGTGLGVGVRVRGRVRVTTKGY